MAAFVALYSCGAAGEFHPFPLHPSAVDNVCFKPSFDLQAAKKDSYASLREIASLQRTG